MPAHSIAQQEAAAQALRAVRGEIDSSELTGGAAQMFRSMSKADLEDFASTPMKGLPARILPPKAPATAPKQKSAVLKSMHSKRPRWK